MLKHILIATMVAGAFASVPLASSAQERAVVVVREAPPPMRAERVPGPRRGFEWAPGHWAWRHGQYVWVDGHWIRERRGMHWEPDRWVARNGHWEMVSGHWERGARMGGPGMGDRDHDGVPNRFDRDRDNDGVPNRFDNHPNNPNRR